MAQANFPVESVEQRVLAQNRPDHGAGTSREDEAPDANSNPVDDNCEPAPVKVAGQTVYGH